MQGPVSLKGEQVHNRQIVACHISFPPVLELEFVSPLFLGQYWSSRAKRCTGDARIACKFFIRMVKHIFTNLYSTICLFMYCCHMYLTFVYKWDFAFHFGLFLSLLYFMQRPHRLQTITCQINSFSCLSADTSQFSST